MLNMSGATESRPPSSMASAISPSAEAEASFGRALHEKAESKDAEDHGTILQHDTPSAAEMPSSGFAFGSLVLPEWPQSNAGRTVPVDDKLRGNERAQPLPADDLHTQEPEQTSHHPMTTGDDSSPSATLPQTTSLKKTDLPDVLARASTSEQHATFSQQENKYATLSPRGTTASASGIHCCPGPYACVERDRKSTKLWQGARILPEERGFRSGAASSLATQEFVALGQPVPISARSATRGLDAPASPLLSSPESFSPTATPSLSDMGDKQKADGSGVVNRPDRIVQRRASASLATSLKRKVTDCTEADCSSANDEDSDEAPVPLIGNAFKAMHRKKRHKCSPEQIAKLEYFFASNRNPTGQVRAQLARDLLMPERSIQIWMQNRRAKLKRKGEVVGSQTALQASSASTVHVPLPLQAGASESSRRRKTTSTTNATTAESVTVIPAYSLCIGTWRRVGLLICFFSRRLQNLTWYLQSESVGYKLETPWSIVQKITFDGPFAPTVPEQAEGVEGWIGHVSIKIEHSPTFFMEVFRSDPSCFWSSDAEFKRTAARRQCADFTEGQQATSVMTHVIVGPYQELREAIEQLNHVNAPFQGSIEFQDLAVQAQLQAISQTARTTGQQSSLSANPSAALSDFQKYKSPDWSCGYSQAQQQLQILQPPSYAAGTAAPSSVSQRGVSWEPLQTQRSLGALTSSPTPHSDFGHAHDMARSYSGAPEPRGIANHHLPLLCTTGPSSAAGTNALRSTPGNPTVTSLSLWNHNSPNASYMEHMRQASGSSSAASLGSTQPALTSSDSSIFSHSRILSWWEHQDGHTATPQQSSYAQAATTMAAFTSIATLAHCQFTQGEDPPLQHHQYDSHESSSDLTQR
ncbi:hypothetical protein K437DRAFT_95032 [Tilletiaria anomala UBC 951]|uniref:Homeobox domain-containing protein n=1 Tax=Tilletiaria anomala (strain ATCC 24038 / CBS 436.72 / UBC 951) TaxID=1037660 RepID=A0A066WKW0_TILAU|nr:uncharacterized protein K437DRAFT_95032 [Tilletiaria anomala UBC 951]KDN53213.1 hypothetical protein K437DRAFT_95032 [Tilletiaria anomala UBC 951]